MNISRASAKQRKLIPAWILWSYVAFVVYGSLVPLQYADRSLESAVAAFKNIPFLTLGIDSQADWFANLLLFIPLFFLAGLRFNAAGSMGRRALVAILLAAAGPLFATVLEFTQLFFPQRTVSQNDIFAESIGGWVGLACHWHFGPRFENWLQGLWSQQQGQGRVTRLLHAYLILLLLFNVLPLDLTLSPVDLFHKWKDGRVILVPFAGLKGGWAQGAYETFTDALIWAPVGVLWTLQQTDTTAKRVLLRGLAAAGVIELLQLFVYTRVTDVTDIFLAGVGAVCGWALVQRMGNALPAMFKLLEQRCTHLWLGWAMLTIGIFWFPFNFNLADLNSTAASTAFTRLPFTTYYFTSEYHAVNELLRKVGFFLPGGALLGLGIYKDSAQARRVAKLPLLLMFSLAVLVEVGQLALPGKVADLTDALLEFSGGVMGYTLALWIGSATPRPRANASDPRVQLPVQPANGFDGYKGHLANMLVLCAALGLLLKAPGLPYNVGELLEPGLLGMVSVLALGVTVYGIANGSFWLFPSTHRSWLLAFPLVLAAHGACTWFLLRLGVPAESLDDIVGSPVLGWPWQGEMLCRYVALHLCLVLQVLGAALCVRMILRPASLADFFYWVLVSGLLAWPLHLAVVAWAATDNLTELMADNASFMASSALATAGFLTCLAASAVSAAIAGTRRVVALLVVASIASIGAAALYWLGTEHTIVKYGQVFSAFQFLLSPDREHYATGMSLMLRFGMAFAVVCGGLAACQWLSWRRYCGTLKQRPAGL